MSDLQLALAAAGAVIIVSRAFNVVQNVRAPQAERDFGEPPPDAPLDTPPARREPTLGDLQPATESPIPMGRVPAPDETSPRMPAGQDLQREVAAARRCPAASTLSP